MATTHAQYRLLASLRGLTRDGGRPSQRALADYIGLDASLGGLHSKPAKDFRS